MKKIISLFACFAICIFSYAQAPQKFNYQGVARGSSGNVFSNQLLGFKLSILQGSPTGTAVYVVPVRKLPFLKRYSYSG